MSTDSLPPLAVLSPDGLQPAPAVSQVLETPYGPVSYSEHAGVRWLADTLPQALIYSAKALGHTWVVELLPLRALNPLPDAGDLLIPDDLVDLTVGRPTTLFVEKGYGFVQQRPPYCPLLRTALHQAACQMLQALPAGTSRPRLFARGIYGAVEDDNGTLDTTAYHTLHTWGVDVFGSRGVPTGVLARELELCYAPLGYIVTASPLPRSAAVSPLADTPAPPPLLHQIIALLQEHLPRERTCPCARTMQGPRERGLVGDDWRTWL